MRPYDRDIKHCGVENGSNCFCHILASNTRKKKECSKWAQGESKQRSFTTLLIYQALFSCLRNSRRRTKQRIKLASKISLSLKPFLGCFTRGSQIELTHGHSRSYSVFPYGLRWTLLATSPFHSYYNPLPRLDLLLSFQHSIVRDEEAISSLSKLSNFGHRMGKGTFQGGF